MIDVGADTAPPTPKPAMLIFRTHFPSPGAADTRMATDAVGLGKGALSLLQVFPLLRMPLISRPKKIIGRRAVAASAPILELVPNRAYCRWLASGLRCRPW